MDIITLSLEQASNISVPENDQKNRTSVMDVPKGCIKFFKRHEFFCVQENALPFQNM